jgi:EAL domain-containing protein (putative c-di-GMP-specific phosphodiesterase class I)
MRHDVPGRPGGATAICDPSYCLRITVSACENAGLQPSSIVFEVTETDLVTDVRHLRGILAFYRKAGFRVALDDLGAGYAGLNLLKDLEPDIIKIDRHLITDIDTDTFKQNIVEHLISLAHKQQIKVVAEGIETQGEYTKLKAMGADLLQGYYLARPQAELIKQSQLDFLQQAA